jgi:hypothetical protein
MLLKELQTSKHFQEFIQLYSKDKEIITSLLNTKYEIFLVGLLLAYFISKFHIGIQVGKYGYCIYYTTDDVTKFTLPITVESHLPIIYKCNVYNPITFSYYNDAIKQLFKMLDNGS